jgi:cytochrome P450
MILHPEVQQKAQEEIDQIVGKDRLPEFSDRQSLPYIDAIVKEVLRWVTHLLSVTSNYVTLNTDIGIDGTPLRHLVCLTW